MKKYLIIIPSIILIILSIAFLAWFGWATWFKNFGGEIKNGQTQTPVKKIGEKTTVYGMEIQNKCFSKYDDFIKTFGADYQKCLADFNFNEEYCGGFDPTTDAVSNINIVVILDSSGSMAERIDGETKIDVAKKAVSEFLVKIPQGVNTGLVVYGQKGSNSSTDKSLSCSGIEEVVKLGRNNNNNIITAMNSFSPRGWTPIAGSLDFAKNIFKTGARGGKNYLILVSDGIESCDGNPLTSAKSLKSEIPGIKLNVIGFTSDTATHDALQKIASGGGGSYLTANNSADITKAFNDELLIIKKDCLVVTNVQMTLRYKSNYINNLNCWLSAYDKESKDFTENITDKFIGSDCNQEIANVLKARQNDFWYKKEALAEKNDAIYNKMQADFIEQLNALNNVKN
jgi:hypothetical protein